MLLATETERPVGASPRERLHDAAAAAIAEIHAHATAARTLVGRDDAAARAAIAAIRARAAIALGEMRALVALLPAAAGRALADDVHDTLGHALSLASLLAGGAAARLATEPALARDALAQLARLSADTSAELERLLGAEAAGERGVATPPTGERGARLSAVAPLAPPPSGGRGRRSQAAAAVEQLRSLACAGSVTFDVDGAALAAAPPEVAAAVHRIVREALTNARTHARGAPVRVRVADDGGGALAVAVVNPPAHSPAAPGSGRGIPGMRRRAHAVGGALAAGPTGDGGFRVDARLPR
ncbi:sensor histidine kinase [Conexibacter arvalis]|uniref:histidine kinase n=1 Tax=Conexibacter arvalis TaxID=912552 RepID=A0A840I732_9ACTN|nr:histidine kinase [Conexibacter arvalis]MBB4660716.1 signal transduction histidine kinase [Conexibacter arvalis]